MFYTICLPSTILSNVRFYDLSKLLKQNIGG